MLPTSLPCNVDTSDLASCNRSSIDDCLLILINGLGLCASSSSGSLNGEPSTGLTGLESASRNGSFLDLVDVGVVGLLFEARDVLPAARAAAAYGGGAVAVDDGLGNGSVLVVGLCTCDTVSRYGGATSSTLWILASRPLCGLG